MVDYTEEEIEWLQSPLHLGEDRPDEVADGGEGDAGIPPAERSTPSINDLRNPSPGAQHPNIHNPGRRGRLGGEHELSQPPSA